MFGIITLKGRASSRWIVHEARNAEDAFSAILEAAATGSVEQTDTLDETLVGGRVTVLARVQRICHECGKPALAYGECHINA